VRPDFKGLPPGSGSVQKGQLVWDGKCASCHGVFGESNEFFPPIVGGVTADDVKRGRVDALVHKPEIQRTTLMKLSSIATLWDYINRAMPWNAPKTLSVEEVYAVTAYILNLGELLPEGFVLSDKNIGEVQKLVPNRNGMTRKHGLWDAKGRPDVKNPLCMKDCPVGGVDGSLRVVSAIPDYARNAHGDLAGQNRLIGPVRGVATAASASGAQPVAVTDARGLAGSNNCMACHAVDKKIVGPSFSDIAGRYKGDGNAQSRLEVKVKEGGAGTWGSIPMPPHPEMKAADIQVLVRWVLAGAAPN
jgi:cytochrome c